MIPFRPLPVLLACAMMPMAVHADNLPDLAVLDLVIDAECHAVATVRNQGPAPLPGHAYDALYGSSWQFTKDGASFGGARLNTSDPARSLVNVDGTITIRSGNAMTGTAEIGFEVDQNHVVDEATEANNTLTRTLTCGIAHADIAVSAISFDAGCKPVVTLANAGGGTVPDTAYSTGNTYLQRWIDGKPGNQLYLRQADPQKALAAPGAQFLLNDTLPFAATQKLKYMLVQLPVGNVTGNDSLEVAVPARCGGPADSGGEAGAATESSSGTGATQTAPIRTAPVLKAPVRTLKRLPPR